VNKRTGLHAKFVNINTLGKKRWKLFPAIALTGLRRRQKISITVAVAKAYGGPRKSLIHWFISRQFSILLTTESNVLSVKN
jgi:hypothetical protein